MSNRPSKETKLVNFNLPVSLIEKIDSLGESNRTSLVIDLLTQAVAMRSIGEQTRDYMYAEAKSHALAGGTDITNNPQDIKNLIDGLWI